MDSLPNRWMAQQRQRGYALCLMLEGHNTARQPLLAGRGPLHYCELYSETDAAQLASSGPVIVLLEQMQEPALVELLQHPESNWGWMGSLPAADLDDVTRHWRARLLLGPKGQQVLYRIHDNRTLGRALAHLSKAHWPHYLGPLISVCYWHEGRWCQAENPAPGDYPVPDPPPWLGAPNPQAEAILHANILRYLLAEHSEDLAALVEFQDPRVWLAQVLEQACTWQWRTPEQLEFLVVRRLEEATRNSFVHWQPRVGEAPGAHFERVVWQWRRKDGKGE
ncbi:DUF4123 domain-containing protein [Pseudomonas khavaziana]|uniref:DUF4123 domain-containing protein n=1 Tax=Pseudomonas khavaziana TaxID=2842351 RepID=UPI001C3C49CD|nr:DUF4123 domain-containing protein [Pseudomonas khavaziana]MBV4481436.1 DUF4123 domain-containing protein [Pseudomonas khavaziana]